MRILAILTIALLVVAVVGQAASFVVRLPTSLNLADGFLTILVQILIGFVVGSWRVLMLVPVWIVGIATWALWGRHEAYSLPILIGGIVLGSFFAMVFSAATMSVGVALRRRLF